MQKSFRKIIKYLVHPELIEKCDLIDFILDVIEKTNILSYPLCIAKGIVEMSKSELIIIFDQIRFCVHNNGDLLLKFFPTINKEFLDIVSAPAKIRRDIFDAKKIKKAN